VQVDLGQLRVADLFDFAILSLVESGMTFQAVFAGSRANEAKDDLVGRQGTALTIASSVAE
jgi:hypothetical protein